MGENAKTMVELARIFNVSQPRISQWKKAGMPVESDGTYDPIKIQRWRVLRLNEKVETLLPTEIENSDSQQAVSEVINGLGRFRELVDTFKRDRGDILCGLEGRLVSVVEDLLDSVTPKQIAAMPVRDRLRLIKDFVSSITSLYTSEKIERGESTSNISIIVQQITEIKKQRSEEEKKSFLEWVEEHRIRKIPIPSHSPAIERMRREGISLEGLIIENAPNNLKRGEQ